MKAFQAGIEPGKIPAADTIIISNPNATKGKLILANFIEKDTLIIENKTYSLEDFEAPLLKDIKAIAPGEDSMNKEHQRNN